MIFQKISVKIALQFMAFVFGFLLITGGIFISIDMVNRDHATRMRLERQMLPLLNRLEEFGSIPKLPQFQRDRVRIIDARGTDLFSGNLFEDVPFEPDDDIITVISGNESYDILTTPVSLSGHLVGYIQVADRSLPDDLGIRILLYLLISVGISGLTFGVGLFFARRSLKPAEQMMERLEQFTQDASHELRTPITAVSTSLDLALATNDYRENILTAKKDLKDVAMLVERLLELAQLDKFLLQKESVALSELIQDSVEKHRPFAEEKKIMIESRIAPRIQVSGDATLIRQIMGNLLMNAIKFNKPQGHIEVTLAAHTLTVRDTGRGIASESLPHIFNRFYQEDASRTKKKEGLGLGLALVKRIVDLHCWTIDVQSESGEGTTFTIHLS